MRQIIQDTSILITTYTLILVSSSKNREQSISGYRNTMASQQNKAKEHQSLLGYCKGSVKSKHFSDHPSNQNKQQLFRRVISQNQQQKYIGSALLQKESVYCNESFWTKCIFFKTLLDLPECNAFQEQCYKKYDFFETLLYYPMESKHIIQREGIYFQDLLKGRHAISRLTAINQSEDFDSNPIFCQSQSDGMLVPNIFTPFEADNYPNYDLDCFFNSSTTMDIPFPKNNDGNYTFNQVAQPNQERVSASIEAPSTEEPTPTLNNQRIDDSTEERVHQKSSIQQIYQSNEGNNEYVFCGRKQSRGLRKGGQQQSSKKIDKEKNIFPNIAKRTIKIMSQDCRALTQKYFKRRNLDFAEFEKQYENLMKSNCSGYALSDFFVYRTDRLENMSRTFVAVFERYLRKRYMVLALKKGKMQDLQNYVSCKNRQLMYFSQYLNSQERV